MLSARSDWLTQCRWKWWIFTSPLRGSVNIHHYSPPLRWIIVNTAWKRTCRGPEIPGYGPVFFENTGKSGSIVFHETWRVRRVSGTGFFPNRTFSVARKIRSPDTSLKRGVSRPGNCLIRPDLLRITVYRRLAQPIKLSNFTLIPCYFRTNFHGTKSIMGVRFRNSTVRELSISDISWYVTCHLRFRYRIFHGTWSVTWYSPIGYSTVREVSFGIPLSDISRYVKCHSRFPYWISHETKVWEGINVSWKGTLYPMHSSPNSLRTPLITITTKLNFYI